MTSTPLKILVVDDTIVYRKAVSDIIAHIPGAEVIDVAHNGKIALTKIKRLQPDLITLDIEMPEMNGIELLQQLQRENIAVDAIIISPLSTECRKKSIQCLELGAFDFIIKPAGENSITQSREKLRARLTERILAYQQCKRQGSASPCRAHHRFRQKDNQAKSSISRDAPLQRANGSEIVVIAISTGGPKALASIIPMLPGNLGVPVLIAQHMPPIFTQSLASSLDKKSSLTVKEAAHREKLNKNTVYIAPGGRQMKLAASADGKNRFLMITDDPRENVYKPSADYLFKSVADYYVDRATAVIMTGMGSDGCKGLAALKAKGAITIGQDEETCVVYGMPKAAIERGLVDKTVPLQEIAVEIIKSVS